MCMSLCRSLAGKMTIYRHGNNHIMMYVAGHEHTEGHHCIHLCMLHYDTAYTLTAPYVDTSFHPPPPTPTHTSRVRRCQHIQPRDGAIVEGIPRPWHDAPNM